MTITDHRTGKYHEITLDHGMLDASELGKINLGPHDVGLLVYDPGFANTASCRSSITFLDGRAGSLHYRGYPIDQLAAKSTYLESAYLLIHGELPTAGQLAEWDREIAEESISDHSVKRVIGAFPRGLQVEKGFLASLAFVGRAGSMPHSDVRRWIANIILLAAWNWRHWAGLELGDVNRELPYVRRFWDLMFRSTPDVESFCPEIERALEVSFILHADHEQNCSTSVMRILAGAEVDLGSAVTAAAASAQGPMHGAENGKVMKMLRTIGSVETVPAFVRFARDRQERLPGFGHRVYRAKDPRAEILKSTAEGLFATVGRHPLMDIALTLERVVLNDEWFAARNVYASVDLYSGILYEAIGFPDVMYSILFAIPRLAGWLAQWEETRMDGERTLVRPRQIYIGHGRRDYVIPSRR